MNIGVSSLNDSFEEFDLDEVLNDCDWLNVVVNQDQFKNILSEVGTEINPEDGLLVDSNTKENEKSNSENVIKFERLGVLSAGSKVFIEKNIASFSEFLGARSKNNL
jgi:hypothetical protein